MATRANNSQPKVLTVAKTSAKPSTQFVMRSVASEKMENSVLPRAPAANAWVRGGTASVLQTGGEQGAPAKKRRAAAAAAHNWIVHVMSRLNHAFSP
jgi:hypothetical protein